MPLTLLGRSLDIAAPHPGILVGTSSFYTHWSGSELMSRYTYSSRSDTTDASYVQFSPDNGETWTDPQIEATAVPKRVGMMRRIVYPGVAYPQSPQLFFPIMQGILPSDNPLEGLMYWTLRYGVSIDGGRTLAFEEPVVQEGPQFNEGHPFPPVWVGKNCAMIGDKTCVPIWRRDGKLLLPVQLTLLDSEGKLYNPGGGYTYHNAAVLLGSPTASYQFRWQISDVISLDPSLSTRGLIEPTLAELPDGRVLMVMRGSNDNRPTLPGYKWYSFSQDGGLRWSTPKPWCYDSGERFFSPSSCSQLISHSSGRLFWIGNITPTNPRGNLPRYPLVVGEVNQETLQLKAASICTIDDRQENEAKTMTLSNFYAREDRKTGGIIVHCARFKVAEAWDGDAFLYRVAVE